MKPYLFCRHPVIATAVLNPLFHLRIFVIGFCMGMADLVPGVSGGTIAFISGIYDRLIRGLKSFDFEALKMLLEGRPKALSEKIPWLFLLFLGCGLLTAVFTLSGLLRWLFIAHPVHLWSVFMGLIVGSLFFVFRRGAPWPPSLAGLFLVFAVATWWIVGLPGAHLPTTPPFVFIGGAIAVCAMILPGISGSYVLVILGQYHALLTAIDERHWIHLVLFSAGIGVGVLTFVRVVAWLLHHHYRATIAALAGIMTGALRTVWPWKASIDGSAAYDPAAPQVNVLPEIDGAFWVAVIFFCLGAILVGVLQRLGNEKAGS